MMGHGRIARLIIAALCACGIVVVGLLVIGGTPADSSKSADMSQTQMVKTVRSAGLASLDAVDKTDAAAVQQTETTKQAMTSTEASAAVSPSAGSLSIDEAEEGTAYASGELLVSVEPNATDADIAALCEKVGATSSEVIANASDSSDTSVVKVELPADTTVAEAASVLETDPSVSSAQPDYLYTIFADDMTEGYVETGDIELGVSSSVTNDTYASNQWALTSVGIGNAWSLMKAQGQVSVAVVDTGCNMSHPDLAANINTAYAYDVQNKSHAVTDSNGHGTHVAGIISAVSDNGIGVSGVSYNAKIIPIDVMRSDGTIHTSDLIAAYVYIINNAAACNIKVVNMSLGSYNSVSSDDAFLQKVDAAYAAGILTVCAAGNADGTHALTDAVYPSDYATCVSVVNLQNDTTIATDSCYGAAKDISAPGSYIYSTSKAGGYVYMSGTSMASPLVAGIAALLFADDANLTCDQAKSALYSTATDLGATGFDNVYAWGKVNPTAALAYVNNIKGYGSSYTDGSGKSDGKSTDEPLYTRTKTIPSIRLSGNTRYDTMAAIVDTSFADDSCKTVILAMGEGYADALSASAFAGVLNCPIITTPSMTLGSSAQREIERLGASTVYILGGQNAISSAAEQAVRSIDGVTDVIRIQGGNRYDTNMAIYQQGVGSWSDTCIITTGSNYADSLSIAPYAFATKTPVFLTSGGTLPESSASAIREGGFTKAIIIGGYSSVSESVRNQLGNSLTYLRLSGDNRYATSEAIIDWMTGSNTTAAFVPDGTFSCDNMAVTTGTNYPDGLVSVDMLGPSHSVLMLTSDSSDNLVRIDRVMSTYENDISNVYILGGEGAINSTVVDRIANAG